MEISLKPAERDYLEATLETALGTLRDEVHHADDYAYKASLKEEQELLRGLLAKLRRTNLNANPGPVTASLATVGDS